MIFKKIVIVALLQCQVIRGTQFTYTDTITLNSGATSVQFDAEADVSTSAPQLDLKGTVKVTQSAWGSNLHVLFGYDFTGTLPSVSSCTTPSYSRSFSVQGIKDGSETSVYDISTSESNGYSWEVDYVATIGGSLGYASKLVVYAAGLKGKIKFYLDDVYTDGYSVSILGSIQSRPIGGVTNYNFEKEFNLVQDFTSSYVGPCTNRCAGSNAQCLIFRTGSSTPTKICGGADNETMTCNVAIGMGYGAGVNSASSKFVSLFALVSMALSSMFLLN